MGILLICIHDLATPFHRGFQCNDESIRYPYKESTVSSGICYSFGSGINVLLILALEYIVLINNDPGNNSNSSSTQANRDEPRPFQARIYIRNVYCRLLVWLFGSIASELLTDISKFTIGRLRPHFIDICRPEIITEAGRLPLHAYCANTKDPFKYLTNYICTGPEDKQRDARLSFLSGHSSYSAFSAVYAVIYIQTQLDVTKLGLMKSAFQVLIISAAYYTGLSRVSDYKHHWQDVLAGLTLGTVVATSVARYVWPHFHKNYTKLWLNATPRPQPVQSGEELSSFSY